MPTGEAPPSNGSGPPSQRTLVDFVIALQSLNGEFIVYDNGYRPRSFTYARISGMARAFAAQLRASGVRKGDNIILWSENRPGWIAALWGCVLDGVVLVPIDYRVSADFVLTISQLVSARLLLTGDEVTSPPNLAIPVWHLAAIEEQSIETLDPIAGAEPGDTVEIVFTSGATAEPKGVVITHRNLLANMVPVEREIQKYKKFARPFFPIRFLNLLPLSHLFGQAMAAWIPPMIEGVVVFMKSLDPTEIVRQIRSRRISVVVCVPRMLEVLQGYVTSRFPETSAPDKGGPWWVRWWRFRRVHWAFGLKFWAFVVGAAPLSAELEQFWSRLGFLVIQGYGLTETAPIVTLNHPFHARKGTVGKPVAGVDVSIAPDGEILVRGPNVTTGYYRNAEASAAVFKDGWLHTGDLGEIAPDGSLIVRGRKKEVIVTPDGLNVFPDDVEKILENTPGVKEAAVIGPDRVNAVLVLKPGANPNDLVSEANRNLEEYQKIRTVHIWPGDSLPRTEGTGKLKRTQIRDWLEGRTPKPATPAGGILDILNKLAPGRTITPDTTLEELGLSSLDRVELMSAMQQSGSASFPAPQRVSDLMEAPATVPEPALRYPRWSRSFPARIWRRILLPAIVLPMAKHYARIEVRGREHLKGLDGPLIFASNHQSHLDTPVILAALPRRLRYRVAPAMGKEFFDAWFHPAGRRWAERLTRGLQYYLAILSFNAFPLPQREEGAGEALHYAGELAAEGWSILIFPEGKRSETGEILPFQPGVALMAARLALPVVPVRLRGLDKVLPRDAKWAEPGSVEVAFGEPIRITPGNWRERTREIQDAVEHL